MLLDYLPFNLRYTGIELNLAAYCEAVKDHPLGEFHNIAAQDFFREQHYDLVIFNEMLYYLKNPVAQLSRYSRMLNPGGVIIISIWQKPCSLRHRVKQWVLRRPLPHIPCTAAVLGYAIRWETLADESITHPNGSHPWRVTAFRTSPVCYHSSTSTATQST